MAIIESDSGRSALAVDLVLHEPDSWAALQRDYSGLPPAPKHLRAVE